MTERGFGSAPERMNAMRGHRKGEGKMGLLVYYEYC